MPAKAPAIHRGPVKRLAEVPKGQVNRENNLIDTELKNFRVIL
jgi:hypothetical protein